MFSTSELLESFYLVGGAPVAARGVLTVLDNPVPVERRRLRMKFELILAVDRATANHQRAACADDAS